MDAAVRDYLFSETLRNGVPIRIRAIHAEDKSALQDILHHLSKDSRFFRFLTPKGSFTEKELAEFTELDFQHHVGLLATIVESGIEKPVGVGRFITTDSSKSAELAFEVEEEYQGLGVATILLKHLSEIARDLGVTEFTALVHPDNRKMLEVFQHCWLPMETLVDEAGVLELHLRLIA